MRSRRKILIGGVVALIVVVAISLVLWHRERQMETERKLVHAWTGVMIWWDHSRTETENNERQIAELRKIAPQAVAVLSRDLTAREFKWARKFPILTSFARDRDPEQTRVNAAHYLGAIGADAKPAVPNLVHALQDEADRVQMTAAFSLGQIGDSSPPVLDALTRASQSKNQNVVLAAEFSLWQLTGSTQSVARLNQLITNRTSWASICIMRIGEPAKIFGPALLAARDQLPWGDVKMQTVEAHWLATRDKQPVLETLHALSPALDRPSPTNSVGWTEVESAIAYAAHRLDTEPEFRAALRPLLQRLATNNVSAAQRTAQTYLPKHTALDKEQN